MIYLVRYDILLDVYVRHFFENITDNFSKTSSNKYICGSDLLGSQIFGDNLEKFILSKLNNTIDILNPNYYFIIGDCRPSKNIFLELDGKQLNNKKAKYYLNEKDIIIDNKSFNRRVDFVFNRLFKRKTDIPSNIFAISHLNLSADLLKRFLKFIFGNINCQDIDNNILCQNSRCIYNTNDHIDLSIKNKSRLNSMDKSKQIINVLRQYIGECIGINWSNFK